MNRDSSISTTTPNTLPSNIHNEKPKKSVTEHLAGAGTSMSGLFGTTKKADPANVNSNSNSNSNSNVNANANAIMGGKKKGKNKKNRRTTLKGGNSKKVRKITKKRTGRKPSKTKKGKKSYRNHHK